MSAYYNEIDPYAAQWLRNLIAAGHIAPGDVDERSIADVRTDDLKGYVQCHFFAGIGVWSHALRAAGWPDDRPVWTGSCPCQPFSAAGKGEGTDDPRHLWPEWFRLIREHRPVAVFGEQVSAAIRHGWLDLVSADLEGAGYAIGSAVLGAHSVGAPHIRQRLYFVADAEHAQRRAERQAHGYAHGRDGLGRGGDLGELADAGIERRQQECRGPFGDEASHGRAGRDRSAADCDHVVGRDGQARELADALPAGRPERRPVAGCGSPSGGCGSGGPLEYAAGEQMGFPGRARQQGSASGVALGNAVEQGLEGLAGHGGDGHEPGRLGEDAARPVAETGGAGFWTACDWLPCIDGKARPVEPGTFPLAHGVAGRVGRLRAYGNAIVAPVAAEFIRAYLG